MGLHVHATLLAAAYFLTHEAMTCATTIIGQLVAEPELEANDTRAMLRVASFRQPMLGQRRKKPHKLAYRVTLFGELARRSAARLRRGDWISAEGLFIYAGEFDLYATGVEVLRWKQRSQTLMICHLDDIPEKKR